MFMPIRGGLTYHNNQHRLRCRVVRCYVAALLVDLLLLRPDCTEVHTVQATRPQVHRCSCHAKHVLIAGVQGEELLLVSCMLLIP